MHQFKWFLLVASIASLCATTAVQDRPEPDRLRQEARELLDKSRDLKAKANEQIEQSENMARRAKELVRQSEEAQQKRPDDRTPTAEPRGEPRREGDRIRPTTRDRDDERPGLRQFPDGPRHGWRGGRFHRPDFAPGEFALRKYHVTKAIKHLRAAGLNEQADRLEQRLLERQRRLKQSRDNQLWDRPSPRPQPERPLEAEPHEHK